VWFREADLLEDRLRHDASTATRLPPSLARDAVENERMRQERDRLTATLQRHEERAQQDWERSYAAPQRRDLEELQQLSALHDQELEEQRLALILLQEEVADARRKAQLAASELALTEQAYNPLGLYAAAAPPQYDGGAHLLPRPLLPAAVAAPPHTLPSAPLGPAAPAGKAGGGGPAGGTLQLPPPYELSASKPPSELFQLGEALGQHGFLPTAQQAALRCASCFDLIRPDLGRGFTGRAVNQGTTTYHEECYIKKAAPHCSHCGWTLTAHPERGLSGAWGTYKGKSYHVECYQFNAGPRCCSCFDVIFANPAKGLTGRWRSLPGGQLIHEECFRRLHGLPPELHGTGLPGYDSNPPADGKPGAASKPKH
jgi:hypothetical protein